MNSKARGFTLVEVLIVVLLSSVIMAAIYQTIIAQERATRQQYAIIDTQQNARVGLGILTSELKEISSVDGDVLQADSLFVTFRGFNKAGYVCTVPGFNMLGVAELGAPFAIGDSILVFSEGNVSSTADDSWVRGQVSVVVNQNVGLCGANPLGATSWNLITVVGSTAGVLAGAPVRSFTHTRYRIVNNGEWGQLLRRVSAPNGGLGWSTSETSLLDQLANIAEGGLRFRYFSANGTLIPWANLSTNLNNIMRVQVKVSGKAVNTASANGSNRYQDSLVSTVYLRGNFRTQ
jgi:prepilin-type N-terminal cleavage/methylation domain-containing protein